MTVLLLVRHGETVWHAENRYTGVSDIELTRRGERQAQQLANWARDAELDGLWSSPLSRAMRTVGPAAEAAGLFARVDERLREVDFGQGEGKTIAEMREVFPDAVAAFYRDPVGNHLPGGENPHDAVKRARAALLDIAAEHPDGRVLIVAHTTVLRLVLCDLLGIPVQRYRRVFPVMHNGTITELRLRGNEAALLRFNAPTLQLAVDEEDQS